MTTYNYLKKSIKRWLDNVIIDLDELQYSLDHNNIEFAKQDLQRLQHSVSVLQKRLFLLIEKFEEAEKQ